MEDSMEELSKLDQELGRYDFDIKCLVCGKCHGDGGNLPCMNYTWEEACKRVAELPSEYWGQTFPVPTDLMDKLSKLEQENGLYNTHEFISDMVLCGGTGERLSEGNTVHVIMVKQRQRMENLITLTKELSVSQEYVDNLKVKLSEETLPVITQEFLNRTYKI
jgi:hypothetical protein